MTRVHRRGLKTEIAIFCCDFPDYWKDHHFNIYLDDLDDLHIQASNLINITYLICEKNTYLRAPCNETFTSAATLTLGHINRPNVVSTDCLLVKKELDALTFRWH